MPQTIEEISVDQISARIDQYKDRMEEEKIQRLKAERKLEKRSKQLAKMNRRLKKVNDSLQDNINDHTGVLAALVESSDDGMIIENRDRQILFINQQFLDVIGVPGKASKMIGEDCDKLRPVVASQFLDPEQFDQSVDHHLKWMKPITKERFELKSGRVIERDFVPIFHGIKHLGNMWKYSDITHIHSTQEAIRKSEEKYRGIIEKMELGFIEVDEMDEIVNVYDSFTKITGYHKNDLLGLNFMDVLIPSDQKERILEQHNLRVQGIGSSYEIKMNKKNGGHVWLLGCGVPIYNDAGISIGSMGMFFDITYRKQLEDELRDSREIAERSSQAEKQFLANMSHEIRNPMNAVIGLVNLLSETNLDSEQKDYLESIKYSTDVITGLISGILDLSKIESGKVELVEKEIQIPTLIEGLVKTYGAKAAEKGIEIQTVIDENLQISVKADVTIINQILLNLLDNALKFTEHGSVKVSAMLNAETEKELSVLFKVADTGIGMTKEETAYVFESFKQANSQTKLKYGGTGLGLSIVKNLVALYGGEVQVESKRGVGTTFILELHLDKVLPRDEAIRSNYRRGVAALKGKNVLIVEDNRINQVYLSGLLKKWKAEYDIANNGVEALELIKKNQYDLVLMDIRMPEMDGYETTQNIRSNTDNPNQNVPIVALTASALVDEREKAIVVGMNDHIPKPFSPEQLEKTLNELNISPFPAMQIKESFAFSAPIDGDYLLSIFDEDLTIITDIFELFLESIDKEMVSLRQLIERNQLGEFSVQAHRIRPNFQQVGLIGFARKFSELEKLADINKPEELSGQFGELLTEMDLIKPTLEENLSRMRAHLNEI